MATQTTQQIRIWAEGIKASDQRAFDKLFRLLYPRLVPYACRYTRNKAVAGDIVQEAFVTLWEKREQLDPDRSVKSYLYRMVRNRALNYVRDHSNERVGLEPVDDARLQSTETITHDSKNSELSELLEQWIEELPQRQQEAFELSRFDGLDHEEIAGVMNISPNTVNNHIVAALEFLRQRYDDFKNEDQTEVNGYD